MQKIFYILLMVVMVNLCGATTLPPCPTCVSATSNLILNPSFESTASWQVETAGFSSVTGTLIPSCTDLSVCGTDVGAIGNPSGSYTGPGTSAIFQDISLEAGVSYNFSVYAGRTDNAYIPTIEMIFYNGASPIAGQTKTANVTFNAYSNCNMSQYTFSGVTPANTTKVRIRLRTTGGYLKVDAMCLTVSCTAAAAGPDQNICNNNSFTLAANSPSSGETGKWTVVAGTCTLSNTASPTATATITGASATLRWTISRGSNGQYCSNFDDVVLRNNPNPSVSATPTDVTCNGAANGSVAALASGGTPGYTYLWTPGNTSTQNLTNVGPGSYTVKVTDTKGCFATASASVSEPAALVASAVGTDVLCNGATNGSANLSIAGGTTPYQIVWNNGATTEDLTSLAAGTYSVTVTDKNLCTATASVTIAQPNILVFTATAIQPACGDTGGAATLSAPTGGTAPYTINAANVPTSNLAAGEYTYVVTDANGCTASAKITIEPFSTTPPTVEAGPDGEVCAHASGQTLPVKTYQLNGSIGGSALSATWSDGGAGGTFSPNANALDAIYTPPADVVTIVLTLTTNDPDGPCGPVSDSFTLTEKPCAGILDPCTCNDVTYNATEVLEVKDFIEIDGSPGQTWEIIVNGGGVNAANGGQPYGTMQLLDTTPPFTTTNTAIPLGTIVPPIAPGSGIYRLDFAHDSGAGYTVTVRNTTTGQELSISNYCIINTFTPTTNLNSTYCVTTYNGGPIDLTSTITDLGAPTNGTVQFFYINAANQETALVNNIFDPLDPQFSAPTTIKIVAKFIPDASNTLDCLLTRDASGQISLSTCALSVSLVRFEAKLIDENVLLNWKTADEKDFSHFEVQKSETAQEFGTIATINGGKNGYYFYNDSKPANGNNYYRLKMVNNDGTFDYSKIININAGADKYYALAENPARNGEFSIQTNVSKPEFTLYNSMGKKVAFSSLSNGHNKFTIKPMQANTGLYFLQISSKEKTSSLKLVMP